MGTKQKFWFEDSNLGLCLFKFSRGHAGEDWAEKVAEQLAARLGLPHARYELGECRGQRGVVSPIFLGDEETLIPGNQLLVALDPTYPARSDRARVKVPQHTISAVADVLARPEIRLPDGFAAGAGLQSAWDVFVGYLLLDALIGNTDRHHENWALIRRTTPGEEPTSRLAPTHDHGSSLGRNEPEERVRARLTTRDAGFSPEAYAERASSKLYDPIVKVGPLTAVEAFEQAAALAPAAGNAWLMRLDAVVEEEYRAIFAALPTERISDEMARFAQRILAHNRTRLLALQGAFR